MGMLVFLALAVLVVSAQAVNVTILNALGVTARLEDNADRGLSVILERNNVAEVIAVVGRLTGTPTTVTVGSTEVIQVANSTSLTITSNSIEVPYRGRLIHFTWDAPKTATLEDCVNYGSHNWYGGPQQKRQYWPIQKLNINKYSYVTKEADNCGVAERYWLSSSGTFIYLDKTVPLFVDSNNVIKDAACFIAEVSPPLFEQENKKQSRIRHSYFR